MAVQVLPWVVAGTAVAGGISEKKASDKAAAKAQEAANFNAELIERDVTLLEKQKDLINANQLVREKVSRYKFEQMQGSVKANFAYAGIDIAQGTPMRVLRQNAREFEFDMATERFNDSVQVMQIADAQESATLNAELTRMEGGAYAGALRAQGTQSLISGFGKAASFGYSSGIFT
jgi:virulence-associated protein VapD